MNARQRGSSIQKIETRSGPRWRFRLDLGIDADGKRKQSTHTFRTEAEAVEKQATYRSQLSVGSYIEPNKVTVDRWLDDWLELGARDWRPSTLDSYTRTLRPVRAALGATRLQKLTALDIERLVRAMLAGGGRMGRPRAPKTVGLMLIVLTAALKEAARRELVGKNVAADVKKPKVETSEMTCWSADQMREFLHHVADDPLIAAWQLSALGLRRGEVLGLRWSDVDFASGVIHIRQARVQAGAAVVTNPPKTAKGRRDIPMHPALADALRRTKAGITPEGAVIPLRGRDDRLVVVDGVGEPVSPARYSSLFTAHARAAGLPPIRLHDLRHSAITILLGEGFPVHYVARFAGHDPAMTLRVYSHVDTRAVQGASDRLGELYG